MNCSNVKVRNSQNFILLRICLQYILMYPDAFDIVFLTAFVWAELLTITEYCRSELLLVLHDASSFNAILLMPFTKVLKLSILGEVP